MYTPGQKVWIDTQNFARQYPARVLEDTGTDTITILPELFSTKIHIARSRVHPTQSKPEYNPSAPAPTYSRHFRKF